MKFEEDMMNVDKYLFQSPYHSPVQFGRPDPSSKQEETDSGTKQKMTAVQSKTPTEIMQKTEVDLGIKPTVTANSIDLYA